MAPTLNVRNDNVESLRNRAQTKLHGSVEDPDQIRLKYLYNKDVYQLEDKDDFEIFSDRLGHIDEVDIFVEAPGIQQSTVSAPVGPNVPVLDETTLVTRTQARGKSGAISIHRVPFAGVPSVHDYKTAGGVSGGGRDSILFPPPKETGPPGHLVVPPKHSVVPTDSASVKSKKTAQTVRSDNLKHKIAFEEFHSQRGVRLLRGSLGPVNNVPMMFKNGYRHVYVSRSFALDHGFIPADTTPGTYGYNGITNLGKWPVQVGSKSVPCTVMLAEDSYFPVILGRSFMEKRGVRTDPIDMTSVLFMDNGERADVEVVVVRDELGQPISIP
ncbi:hypothetical protein MVES1_000425 [Malassezia vespertilionis]|uniref:uncharacterized protein n=1 Tax=Malassezia vespertilionis TaxID=2020962 RepID=UPI0024B28305|nr:uncharacterized protein MVES1_000425 [Malassezia vespertilionis]WFD05099.1 hypothetical protein MVES1_000425 [Malassezia vespertilionis]